MRESEFAEALKVLGEETRLKILRLLMERPLYVCEISAALGLSDPTVSVHLAKLRKFGFVEDRREGRRVLCRLGTPPSQLLPLFRTLLDYLKGKFPKEVERLKKVKLSDVCPYR
ncbi:ArsR/SmtB family transcription factor [Thermovibrio sp.]